ncbi:MAG: outer membrane beta-barrel protein [Phaeodactylibacter sp.]|nr:outer membrane beta-barrel protein [Phaeodactylibacter sp.]MCB9273969.1 outer membrane beta-barrel protein [Lewinellaceae bacterium]
MKNVVILTSLLVFCFSSVISQTTFKKGDIELATGIGIFSTFAKDNPNTIVPPVSARIGVRLASNFSLGGYAAYSSSQSNQIALPDGNFKDVDNEFLILGLRAAAHANRMENWDIYGGAMLGYNIPKVQQTVTDSKSVGDDAPTFSSPAQNKFTYSAFVGGSYYPIKNLGVFAEVGYGISIFNMGVSLKL